METVHGKCEQKNLVAIGSGQVRVPVRMELANVAKKILTTTANCFVTAIEKKDTVLHVLGKVITRVIFVDEFDGYNSEEHTDEFTEKFTPKGEFATVTPMASIVQTSPCKTTKTETDMIGTVATEHVINVGLSGLASREVPYVKELSGVETFADTVTCSSWGQSFMERFEIGETFALDQNVEGILGTDLHAHVREIAVANEKFTVKGVASVCVSLVRNIDGAQTVACNQYDFDFAKTFNKKDVTECDTICGNVMVSNLGMKVENRTTPELVLEAELLFTGHSIVRHDLNIVSDAFCTEHNIELSHTNLTDTTATPQLNMIADVEGNVTMPEASPFIGKVLMSSTPTLGAINVKPMEDKVVVEGVLSSNIVYECEEKHVYGHTAEVPFAITCKIDNCSKDHNINIALSPLSCNVKARRGKELLVDARVGVNVIASSNGVLKVTSDAKIGTPKPMHDHAITIHVAGAKETLWDIAKATNIPTAEIIRQNPGIENGVNPGDRVIMYRQTKPKAI